MRAPHYFSLLYLLCLPVTHVHTLKIPNVQLCQIPQQAWNTNSREPTPFIANDRLAEVFLKWLITLESAMPVQQDFKKECLPWISGKLKYLE